MFDGVVTASRDLNQMVAADVPGHAEDGESFVPPGHNDTVFARIQANIIFQNTTLFVIVVNALWICIDVQWNHSRLADDDGRLPLVPASTVVEFAFCTYFTVELLIRFLAFRRKRCCFRDYWFVFDGFLVALMVMETWVLPLVDLASGSSDSGGGTMSTFSSFRLLRLLRLTRMARIMRFFPALMVLIQGMFRATKAVFWILLFLVLMMYLFAIVFTVQLSDPDSEEPEGAALLFGSLGSSMMTLFTQGVLGDNLAAILQEILTESVLLMLLFGMFVVISSLTLLNMLIGVLCDVVQCTAEEEENNFREAEVRRLFEKAFRSIDSDGNSQITRREWDIIKDSDCIGECLDLLGVDDMFRDEIVSHLSENLFGNRSEPYRDSLGKWRLDPSRTADGADGNKVTLTLQAFVEKVGELRSDVPANSLELEGLRTTTTNFYDGLQRRLENIDLRVAQVLEEEAQYSSDGERETGREPLQGPERVPEPHQDIHKGSPHFGREQTAIEGMEWEGVQPEGDVDDPPDVLSTIPTAVLLHTLEGR